MLKGGQEQGACENGISGMHARNSATKNLAPWRENAWHLYFQAFDRPNISMPSFSNDGLTNAEQSYDNGGALSFRRWIDKGLWFDNDGGFSFSGWNDWKLSCQEFFHHFKGVGFTVWCACINRTVNAGGHLRQNAHLQVKCRPWYLMPTDWNGVL